MDITWNAKSCLSQEWENSSQAATHCPPVWDGFLCWSPTRTGSIATSHCPSVKGSDITKSAFRICSETGRWLDRNGVSSSNGWTNYTSCFTREILGIMKRLGSNEDAQTKINIASNTRILEFVGLSLSLVALLLSLFIFYYFRALRNRRTRVHRHLFLALVIQVAIRLTLYADQLITREWEVNGNATKQANNFGASRRGIENTPYLCEASYISLEYARTAMFMWMFVEGLFLHNKIAGRCLVTVFEERVSPIVYPLVGWVLPIPLTVVWAVITRWQYGHSTCWWGYSFTGYFWILEGPRLAVLIVNLAFLLNILRVLVTKLRHSNSPDSKQALKAVKAALMLLPLLGLTNLLNMMDAPLEKSPLRFAVWSYTTHLLTSTQGFVLAFLYCFRNGEVQTALRNFWRIRLLQGVSQNSTMNLSQSLRTVTANIHTKLLVKASQPPPLLVRTFSNEAIKQRTLQVEAMNHSCNQGFPDQHPSPNHSECFTLDVGSLALIYKRKYESEPVSIAAKFDSSSPENQVEFQSSCGEV